MQRFKFIAIRFVLILLSNNTEAQNIYSNWYFGQFAGITFNTSPPTALIGSQMDTGEGSASISDDAGNLLFYTDGLNVYDRNHTIMPNGSGLLGGYSSTQSALIVPITNSNSMYYIFTIQDGLSTGDLSYSIVDMNLNSGNGDIVPTSKNIFLSTNQTEKLVAASGTNCGIWVLTHQRNNNKFEARLVTSNGISNPIYSDAGSILVNINDIVGVMKVSKNNLKIGLTTRNQIIELLDFNPTTGLINNPIAFLPNIGNEAGYGACFSPDNSKFYISEVNMLNFSCDIFQFDISSANPTTILNSKQYVGTTNNIGDLQIGPDNKIYFITEWYSNFLGVIPNPNLESPACGFILQGVDLGAAVSKYCLPNEIRTAGSGNEVNLGNDTTICSGNLVLDAGAGVEAYTYLWQDGSTNQTFTVTTSGTYNVLKTNLNGCESFDTIEVLVGGELSVDLGPDSTFCNQVDLVMDAGWLNSIYVWQDASANQQFHALNPGTYWVTIDNAGCIGSDSIVLSVLPSPVISVPDEDICKGSNVNLTATGATTYTWSPTIGLNTTIGATVNANPLVTATYTIIGTTNGCSDTALAVVTVIPNPIATIYATPNPVLSSNPLVTFSTSNTDGELSWYYNNLLISQLNQFIMTLPETPGNFVVQLVVKNSLGCADTSKITVVIQEDIIFFVPNSFTPDGNALNNGFYPVITSGIDEASYELLIYDRWGELVYQTNTITDGWDGTYKGKMKQNGTYTWTIKFKSKYTSEVFEHVGNVVLLK
jgi:gliding motility-associated-like protein